MTPHRIAELNRRAIRSCDVCRLNLTGACPWAWHHCSVLSLMEIKPELVKAKRYGRIYSQPLNIYALSRLALESLSLEANDCIGDYRSSTFIEVSKGDSYQFFEAKCPKRDLKTLLVNFLAGQNLEYC